ncbi:MAG: nicotinate-nucleotide adenylyltransferase [Eubacteriaceae bacterium]
MKEKIGLLGGSFNPIHTGHLLLAESARDQFELNKVLFIPTGNNPFKLSEDDISRNHRLNMVALAIEGNPNFEIVTEEIDRPGITYTIDTIEKLEKAYQNVDFYFITGADIMFEITLWKGALQLLKTVKFITTFRPGYSHDKLDSRIEELRDIYDASIFKLYAPEMDISSSDIRSRVKNGYSIRYLLPGLVENYIVENNIYRPAL